MGHHSGDEVVMKDLPYEVIVDKHIHYEAEEWCRQQWGTRWSVIDNRGGTWCCFWAGFRSNNAGNAGKYRYHFQNKEDAALFTLRWA